MIYIRTTVAGFIAMQTFGEAHALSFGILDWQESGSCGIDSAFTTSLLFMDGMVAFAQLPCSNFIFGYFDWVWCLFYPP